MRAESEATPGATLRSFNIARILGDATIPSSPRAWYPAILGAVESKAVVLRSFNRALILGEAVIPSSPVARSWACTFPARENSAAALNAESRNFLVVFMCYLFFLCCGGNIPPGSFAILTTPQPEKTLRPFPKPRWEWLKSRRRICHWDARSCDKKSRTTCQ